MTTIEIDKLEASRAKRLGPSLRRWRDEGAVPRKAKLMAVSGMTLGFTLFWIEARPGWPLTAFVAVRAARRHGGDAGDRAARDHRSRLMRCGKER